jgi:hypothetical protein
MFLGFTCKIFLTDVQTKTTVRNLTKLKVKFYHYLKALLPIFLHIKRKFRKSEPNKKHFIHRAEKRKKNT